MNQLKRFALEIVLIVSMLAFLVTGYYVDAQAPIQVLMFKILSVSVGILHAHLAGKLLFPKVDWSNTTLSAAHYARTVLYFIVPVAYAIGG